jgi:hypothetical protein
VQTAAATRISRLHSKDGSARQLASIHLHRFVSFGNRDNICAKDESGTKDDRASIVTNNSGQLSRTINVPVNTHHSPVGRLIVRIQTCCRL